MFSYATAKVRKSWELEGASREEFAYLDEKNILNEKKLGNSATYFRTYSYLCGRIRHDSLSTLNFYYYGLQDH
jgi:hypothetical protein